MTVPTSVTWAAAAKVASHTAIRDLLDAGSAGGRVRIRDATDVLLASITMSDPCGTVNGTTGQLVITFPANGTAVAGGTAAYADLTDSDNNIIVSVPATDGTGAVSGYVVLNTLTIINGGPVGVLSCTIG